MPVDGCIGQAYRAAVFGHVLACVVDRAAGFRRSAILNRRVGQAQCAGIASDRATVASGIQFLQRHVGESRGDS